MQRLLDKKALRSFTKLVFSAICLVLIFHLGKINVEDFLSELESVRLGWYVGASVVAISVFAIGSLRWKVLLASTQSSLSLLRLLNYYFIGGFFNILLPSTIGGDFMRAYCLKNHQINIKLGLSSVVVERMLGTSAIVLIAVSSLVVQYLMYKHVQVNTAYYIAIVSFLCLMLWIGYLNLGKLSSLGKKSLGSKYMKVSSRIEGFAEALEMMGKSESRLIVGLVISSVAHCLSVFTVYLLSLSLDMTVDFIWFLIYVPLVLAISLFPVSIGGIGLRESGFVLFFVPLGVDAEKALALSVLFYSTRVMLGVIGAIAYILTKLPPREASSA